MKKTRLILLAVALFTLSTAAIIDFQFEDGSATSNCSTLFVTCKATCQDTHIYSTAHCGKSNYFPDCMCDGLMKKETKTLLANSIQLKNIDSFIGYVSGLDIDHHDDLLMNLRNIKKSVQNENYESYNNATHNYFKIIDKLKKRHRELLNDWIKKHSTQQ